MTGEKLHEKQFIEAVKQTQKDTGIDVRFFVGFADVENSVYDFYYEFADNDKPLDELQKQADEFSKIVDKKLKEINIEYEAKRDSFRLKDPVSFVMQKESFETYKARCIDQGSRDGQFKLNLLMQDEKRHAMFKDLIKK
jgi:hypothetical protein